MIKSIIWSVAILGLLIAFLYTNEMDYREAKAQGSMYCQMVTVNIESKGEYGWTDFNENYDEVCK